MQSDLKLLHNVLKLGGRLDPRYISFKQFEEKFKLPDAKELTYKKVDLEDYFLKRERLADYCKYVFVMPLLTILLRVTFSSRNLLLFVEISV